MLNPLKDALRRATAWVRAIFRTSEPAYLTEDAGSAVAPELSAAADMRARMFPGLKEYADLRLGRDAPSERALADALERSGKTIPDGYVGDVALVTCPCTEVIRFVPFDNAHDLTGRGWTVIESWYCFHERIRRWRAKADANT
jgi:hypothetical protein